MMGSFYAPRGGQTAGSARVRRRDIWRRRRHMCGCVPTLCTPCRQLNALEAVGDATCDSACHLGGQAPRQGEPVAACRWGGATGGVTPLSPPLPPACERRSR